MLSIVSLLPQTHTLQLTNLKKTWNLILDLLVYNIWKQISCGYLYFIIWEMKKFVEKKSFFPPRYIFNAYTNVLHAWKIENALQK